MNVIGVGDAIGVFGGLAIFTGCSFILNSSFVVVSEKGNEQEKDSCCCVRESQPYNRHCPSCTCRAPARA